MRIHIWVGCLLMTAMIASVAEASTHKCSLGDHCWTCVQGTKYDGCFLDCNVCGGIRCIGSGSVAETEFDDGSLEKDLAGTGPLQPLLRFPAERLGEVIHPSVAEVYDWLWGWRDAPIRDPHAHQELDLGGGVTIDGQAREFTLSVRQQGDAQLHLLRIESIGRVVLTVQPAADGRHIIEFDTYPEGPERGRSGFIRLDPQ